MRQITIQLANDEGLHARPAGILVKVASRYNCKIELSAKGQIKNAKSIMNILALGLEKGDEFHISADGVDEVEALESLQNLIQSNFEI